MSTPRTHTSESRRLEPQIDAVRAELAAADRRVRRVVREQPLTVVLVALAAGFVLGRIIRG